MNGDSFVALAEIVDALTAKLARDRPTDQTLQAIHQRARRLYREQAEPAGKEGSPDDASAKA
jgi:hypothetical protein